MYQTTSRAAKKMAYSGRSIVCVLIFLLGITPLLKAQQFSDERPGPAALSAKDVADTETRWMKKKLKLSKTVSKEVGKVNLHYAEQMLSLAKQNSAADQRQAGMQKMEKLEKEKEEALRKLLTPEQMKKYLQHRGEIADALRESGNRNLPPPPPGGF